MFALGVTFWRVSLPSEPKYQGKALSLWLRDLDYGSQRGAAARSAIREMGTNSLPKLIQYLTHHDNKLKLRVIAVIQQHFFWAPRLEDDFLWHKRAALACGELGLAGEPALTVLASAATNSQAPEQVVEALSKMLPKSIAVLTNIALNCGSEAAARKAVQILVKACKYPDSAAMSIAGVSNALESNFYLVRTEAIGSLAVLSDEEYPQKVRDGASAALEVARQPEYQAALNQMHNLGMSAAERAWQARFSNPADKARPVSQANESLQPTTR